jgi:hypothetical protein
MCIPPQRLLLILFLTEVIAAWPAAAAQTPESDRRHHTVPLAYDERTAEYLPFFADYMAYAETIWHEAPHGGYWGDGLSGSNGGIRGTSNLTLAAALLVFAEDQDWLTTHQVSNLTAAGLDRTARLNRIRQSWIYLAATHVTGNTTCPADDKPWGRSWQSSLWVGASGLAALLVWDDLDAETRERVERVVVAEADHKLNLPPRNGTPGNTAAEENGWDTQAPAIGVALFPHHPNAVRWLRAAQLLAVNTYSTASDAQSDAPLAGERVRDVVTTVNLHDDFTLDNHGFFHPSYLKVSGQELGESLVMLSMSDRRHGTDWAARYRPYALHNLENTWKVMHRLVLPEGEYAFPSGSDWAIHLPTDQSYYAYIATALQDPQAALAERRGIAGARHRRAASPPGRFLGATNFEWWWEPIALKRFAMAILHLSLARAPTPAADGALRDRTETWFSDPTRILLHRNPRYLVTVSMRRRPTAQLIPIGKSHLAHPHVTTPRTDAILPAGTIESWERVDHRFGTALLMRYSSGGSALMVAAEQTVLWLANASLSPLAIQNDNVIPSTGRTVYAAADTYRIPPLTPVPELNPEGTWINVDHQLGLISASGFAYRPAGQYTRRSAAEDLVRPLEDGNTDHWLLVGPRFTASETAAVAATCSLERHGRVRTIRWRDGPGGPLLEVRVDLGTRRFTVAPARLHTSDSFHEDYPLDLAADGDESTFTVLRNPAGTGATEDAPIHVQITAPNRGAFRALRIVPRPGYGPRKVTLQLPVGEDWQNVAVAELETRPVDIPLAADSMPAQMRLVIHESWDQGGTSEQSPRNTQIAEIAFVPAEDQHNEPTGGQECLRLELKVLDRQ